jgi:hypothetical protein
MLGMENEAIAEGRVRGRHWIRVTRGAHRLVAADDPWRAELAAWQLVLPNSAVFTGLTVARTRGWWLPPLPEDLPIFVAIGPGGCHPNRAGLILSRHPVPPACEVLGGLRLATPAEALLSCARVLGLLDLLVLTDAALHSGDCNATELREAAAQRRRGARLLRRALELADGRSESAYETLLRLLHVACGIQVEPQRVVVDELGNFVARGDLWLVGTTTLHEYDGAHHLTRARQRRDLARGRRVAGVEWVRRGYTSVEVLHQGVSILREADLAVGRRHRPERIRAWHGLLRDSLFTAAGMARFRSNLSLDGTN